MFLLKSVVTLDRVATEDSHISVPLMHDVTVSQH